MTSDIGGVWRTIGGRRIFIKDGEDLETAMKKSGKFKKEEIKDNNKLPEKAELEPKWCEVSESFNPEIRKRIITQINELNKQFPAAFEQDSKLRIIARSQIAADELVGLARVVN